MDLAVATPPVSTGIRMQGGGLVLDPGQGLRYRVLGSDFIFKARAADTEGALGQFEGLIPPGMGTPPHKVNREDKTFFVLDGTFDFMIGQERVRLEAGGFAAVPRGVAHSFTNAGTTPGRLLVTFTPAGHHEEMFEALAQLPAGPLDLERIQEIAARYDVTLLPAEPAPVSNGLPSTNGKKARRIKKDVRNHGMPWEEDYGYAQAVKVGNMIYLAGQLSHDDEGQLVGPAPVDEDGTILDHANMEIQMRQTYKNAEKLLHAYGATLANVVEEVLYVTNMDAAFAVAGRVRKEAYQTEKPAVASTILVTPRLALPPQLIEIKFIAQV